MAQPAFGSGSAPAAASLAAYLFQQALAGREVSVRAFVQADRLHVVLASNPVPDRALVLSIMRQSWSSLTEQAASQTSSTSQPIAEIQIHGCRLGESVPQWSATFKPEALAKVSKLKAAKPEAAKPETAKPAALATPVTRDKPLRSLWHSAQVYVQRFPDVATGLALTIVAGLAAGIALSYHQSRAVTRVLKVSEGRSSSPPAMTNAISGLSSQNPVTQNPVSQNPVTQNSGVSATPNAPLITFKAVGDMIMGTNYPGDRLPPVEGLALLDHVRPFLGGADVLFGNFESTLTDFPDSAKDISQGMTFAFRTPPAYVNVLRDEGFKVLSVANNHSLDFGDPGFADTIAHIEQTGIRAIGAKGQISYLTVKGVPIAFIGFSYLPDHNLMQDPAAVTALIQQAKQQAQIVVVSVHAGAEGSDEVHTRDQTEVFFGEDRGNLVQFAHHAIDQGADLVLGHGPHVPRAIELYQNKLIAYSLGNFIGYRTLATDGVLGNSMILQAQLTPQGDFVAGKIIPVVLNDQGVPYIDDAFRTVSLVRNLTQTDFPQTPLAIDEAGQIMRLNGG